MSNPERLIEDEIRLPSPPAIAMRILEIVKREDLSFKHLAAVIKSDPALLARVLRMANSSFYGLPKKISSIDTAVGVLGLNTLKNIALSFIISGAFSAEGDSRIDFDRFWRRSLTAAVAGEMIAAAAQVKNDDTFITNLLQDVGVIASLVCRREDYLWVLDERAVRTTPLIAIEREVLGYDHQAVGMELLMKWGLPANVYIPIRHHHDPESAPSEFRQTCRIMQMADSVSALYYGSGKVRKARKVQEMLSGMFSIDAEEAGKLIDSVAVRSAALQAEFDIAPDQIRPFSQILQEANNELSRLNMSYEFLVIENREAKERAEQLVHKLKSANDRLRDLASRDGLTNLYNHRHFMEAIELELARTHRHKRPLSLIMFDMDNFKAINDNCGHQGGDAILKMVGSILSRNLRKTDLVARYGGEEFVMILPETNLSGALTKAESCRAAIEAAEIPFLDLRIRATISAGVAVWESEYEANRYKLIDAADQALYRSKKAGRNCVSS